VDDFLTNNQIIIWMVSIISAVVYLRKGITKASVTDSMDLATTRGQIIDDLHNEMDQRDEKWQAKCEKMMTELVELRGQMTLVQELKTNEIIVGVQAGVREDLGAMIAVELHKLKDEQ
jgi:hypothetical protein